MTANLNESVCVMELSEGILMKACTPGCVRFLEGTCPFLPSEKGECPRVRECMEIAEKSVYTAGGM